MLEAYFFQHLPHVLADFLATCCSLVGALPCVSEVVAILVDYSWYGLAFGLGLVPGAHSWSRRCLARALRLDSPVFGISVTPIETAKVNHGRDTLRGTLWLPEPSRTPYARVRDAVRGRSPPVAQGPFPVVIIRTPYGQKRHIELGQGVLAERGFAVLYQDTRGRFGSDGEFVPVEFERADGAATVRWVRAQPWCNGRVAVFGFSYLGFTAWACVGASDPGELQAAVPIITQSRVHSAAFASGGAISLELIVLWLFLVMRVLAERSPLAQARAWAQAWRESTISRAHMHTPLREVDTLLLGRSIDFYQKGLSHPAADGAFWDSRDKLCDLSALTEGSLPPMHLVTGWFDVFAHECLEDFKRVASVQPAARLTVGAHDHWGVLHLPHLQHAFRCLLQCLDENLAPVLPHGEAPAPPYVRGLQPLAGFARKRTTPHHAGVRAAPAACAPPGPLASSGAGNTAHASRTAAGSEAELALPVQLCLLGSGHWRGYTQWPPLHTRAECLWLTASRELAALPGSARQTLHYTYDPGHPTPACGGPAFNPLNSGARNQRAVERRSDILLFTSRPLRRSLVVVGHVRLRLRVSSSAASTDFVARLCEVSPLLGSTNVCEGMTRLHAESEGEGIGGSSGVAVTIELGPIGVELSAGSRLRLHVCSAAHPRWMRNLNGERSTPFAEHVCGLPSVQRVWVDCDESCLVVPIESL